MCLTFSTLNTLFLKVQIVNIALVFFFAVARILLGCIILRNYYKKMCLCSYQNCQIHAVKQLMDGKRSLVD